MSQDEQPPGDHIAEPASRTPMAPMETFEWSARRSTPHRHHVQDHSPDGEGCRFPDPISLGL